MERDRQSDKVTFRDKEQTWKTETWRETDKVTFRDKEQKTETWRERDRQSDIQR